jgi:2-(1,2-epoxy-1,2-dihydrophenyl)acetyl-CoA isomerase
MSTNDPMLEKVLCEHHEQVALVTLNKPRRRNALDVDMLGELRRTFIHLEENDDTRVIVLTGAGPGFCSGADLAAAGGFSSGTEAIEEHYKPAFMAVADCRKPVIGCINGGAAGGGAALAMLCDLLVMADNGYLKLAFSDIGLIPDCGANWLLPQAVGYRRAYQIAVEAEIMDAEFCLRHGLANRVEPADSALQATLSWAQELAQRAPIALSLTKQAMRNALNQSLDQTFSAEGPLQDQCMASKDFLEGITAFFEKRDARFTGS